MHVGGPGAFGDLGLNRSKYARETSIMMLSLGLQPSFRIASSCIVYSTSSSIQCRLMTIVKQSIYHTPQVEEFAATFGRIAFGRVASVGLFRRGRGQTYGPGLELSPCCGHLTTSPLELDSSSTTSDRTECASSVIKSSRSETSRADQTGELLRLDFDWDR
jgi:hypothetical protein